MKNKLRIIFLLFFFVARASITPPGIKINEREYSVLGIDISEHTGKIDFKKIPPKKIQFIYIKATEGEDYVDKKFEYYYRETLKISPKVGFYHFFRFNKDGKKQADLFLKNIKRKHTQMPLVVDVEEWGNSTNRTVKSIVREIKIFIKRVEHKTGRRIVIYTNSSGYEKYIKGHFKNDIWLCSFSNKRFKHKWKFWQYSHKGKFKWAEGWIDLNVFHGTEKQFRNYLR